MIVNDLFISTLSCGDSSHPQRQPCRYPQWPHRQRHERGGSESWQTLYGPPRIWGHTPLASPCPPRLLETISHGLLGPDETEASSFCPRVQCGASPPAIPSHFHSIILFGVWDEDLGAGIYVCSLCSICVSSSKLSVFKSGLWILAGQISLTVAMALPSLRNGHRHAWGTFSAHGTRDPVITRCSQGGLVSVLCWQQWWPPWGLPTGTCLCQGRGTAGPSRALNVTLISPDYGDPQANSPGYHPAPMCLEAVPGIISQLVNASGLRWSLGWSSQGNPPPPDSDHMVFHLRLRVRVTNSDLRAMRH